MLVELHYPHVEKMLREPRLQSYFQQKWITWGLSVEKSLNIVNKSTIIVGKV